MADSNGEPSLNLASARDLAEARLIISSLPSDHAIKPLAIPVLHAVETGSPKALLADIRPIVDVLYWPAEEKPQERRLAVWLLKNGMVAAKQIDLAVGVLSAVLADECGDSRLERRRKRPIEIPLTSLLLFCGFMGVLFASFVRAEESGGLIILIASGLFLGIEGAVAGINRGAPETYPLRARAAEALSCFHVLGSAEALSHGCLDRSDGIRFVCADALRSLIPGLRDCRGSEELVPSLCRVVSHENYGLALEAISVLADIGDSRAVADLSHAERVGSTAEIRDAAHAALARVYERMRKRERENRLLRPAAGPDSFEDGLLRPAQAGPASEGDRLLRPAGCAEGELDRPGDPEGSRPN